MNQIGRGFGGIPDVVKNLIILNVIVFITTKFLFPQYYDMLAMHFILIDKFEPFQIVTHMFMHSKYGFAHIFFNMFSLWMFGSVLEQVWGPKRFLSFYLIAGLGSIGLFTLTNYLQWLHITNNFSFEQIQAIKDAVLTVDGGYRYHLIEGYDRGQVENAIRLYFGQVVGASGAIYGVLVAFGMLFPNTELMLIFFPVPIKAKYFIPILIVIELFLGVNSFKWDNIAHFAHLGGALFGFIMVKIWNRNRNRFY